MTIRIALSLALVLSLSPVSTFAETRAGVVTNLEGTATAARRALPQPVALRFRDDVFQNDRIVTGDRSLVRLLLGGKAVVTIRERSALTITEVPGTSTIDLDDGKIAVAVARDRMRPGERIEVRTPNAIAAVRGTTFVVEVIRATAQAGGAVGGVTTTVYGFSGLVGVSYLGGPLAIGPGAYSTGTGTQPPHSGRMTAEQRRQALAGLQTSGQTLAAGQNAAIDGAMGTTVATFGLDGRLPPSGYPNPFTWTGSHQPPLLPGGLASLPAPGQTSAQTTTSAGVTPSATLIFGDRAGISLLGDDLASSGHTVTMNVQTLPIDLSSFGSIWHVSAFTPLTSDEQTRLAEFLSLGRGLHLTGERACNQCETLNQSLQSFVRSVVAGGSDIRVVGSPGPFLPFFFGPYLFNPDAAGGITTEPNELTTWPALGPGGVLGISGANVLVTGAGGLAVGAVWDGDALAGNTGRLTLLMDSDWLLVSSDARRQIVENLQAFLDDPPVVLALAGPLFRSVNENLVAGPTFLQVLGYTVTSASPEPLLEFSGTRVTTPGDFVEMGDSRVVAVGGFARLADGAEIVQTSCQEPLVSMRGGMLAIVGPDGHLFDLQGRADHTRVDPYTERIVGTDRPLQPGAESPVFSATDGAVVIVHGSAFHVDTALLAATAPLLALAGDASLTTGAHVVDLVANAKLALPNDAVALVNLDRSALTVLNGHLVNVAGGSSLYVAGSLVALANGGALNVLNGLLLNVAGGASASIGGALVNFTGAGNVVNVNNTLVPTALVGGIPVSGPVDSFRIAGVNALTSGSGQGTITINGVALTPTTALSSLTGSLVAVQSSGTVKVGN